MKLIVPSILSLAVYVGLTTSLPTTVERRDGVQCTGMYRGKLYASSLSSIQDTDTDYRGIPIGKDDDGYLTTAYYGSEETWQFDSCTTEGWNLINQEFGQLKLISSGFYDAVTADVGELSSYNDLGHPLRIRPAFDANYGRLDRQWFQAYWKDDKEGGAYVTLTLNGNPNDDNFDYFLPKIGVARQSNKILAEPTYSLDLFTLTLFDIEYL